MRGSKAKAIRRKAKWALDINPTECVYAHTNIRTRMEAFTGMPYRTSTVYLDVNCGRRMYKSFKAICLKGRRI